jgi:hypothetical protein
MRELTLALSDPWRSLNGRRLLRHQGAQLLRLADW